MSPAPGAVRRRQLLLGGAATAAAAVAGVLLLGEVTSDDSSTDTSSTTGSTPPTAPAVTSPPLSPEEAIAVVGTAYLGSTTVDEAMLRAELPELTGADATALIAEFPALQPKVQADFLDGRTVDLDGWILAETEARAAALVALQG